jgi:hypothetical protein
MFVIPMDTDLELLIFSIIILNLDMDRICDVFACNWQDRLGSSPSLKSPRDRARRVRCNNAGKFEEEDGLGSPASAPNLPTRFSVGNAS